MNTLVKMALGKMGRLRSRPAPGPAASAITLPAPERNGGMPLMEALAARHSSREFARRELPLFVDEHDLARVVLYDERPVGPARYVSDAFGLLRGRAR